MTFSNQTNRVSATGSGSAGQEVPFAFPITATSDLKVRKRVTATGVQTDLTETTNYTVTISGNLGGVVTTVTAIEANEQIHIIRDTPMTQSLDLKQGGSFNAENLEDAIDKSRKLGIENSDRLDRTLVFPDSDPTSSFADMPSSIDRASKNLTFDSSGKPTASVAVETGSVSFSTIGTNIAEAANALAVRGLVELDTDDDVEFAEITGTTIISDDLNTKGPWVDVRSYGAVADSGTTDNTTAFTNAIASTKNVHIPFVPGQYYKITNELTVANAGQIIFSNGADVRQATANKRAFILTASDTEIHGLVIQGTQFAASSSNNEKGIDAFGADKDNYIAGIKIRDCKIHNFGDYAIHLEFVEDFDVSYNHVDDIFHAGIQGLQVRRGTINNNIVTDIPGSSPAYGIVLSRQADDSLVTFPRPSEVTIANNVVRNVTNWEGIDTHGGEHLSITGNVVTGCKFGISAVAATEGDDTSEFAPLDVSITGNAISSGVTDGTFFDGITFNGALDVTVQEYGTGVISGNTIRGHGLETSSGSGGIAFRTTRGMLVTGNSIIECSATGINSRRENIGFNISGNTIIDPWSDTVAVYGIRISNPDSRGYVGGNTFKKGSKSAVDVLGIAIRVVDVTTCEVTLGPNDSEAAAYLANSATADRCLRGEFNTTTSTSGTGEDTLATTVIPADSLGIGRFLRVIAAGTITDAAAGNKTVKFYFDTTSITIQAAANTNTDWRFEAWIEYSSAANQRITWAAWNGSTSLQGYDTATADMTADVTMKVTGECADGSDDISQTMWIIDRY